MKSSYFKEKIEELYNQEEYSGYIIGNEFLLIKSEETYFIDEGELLYKNIIVKMSINPDMMMGKERNYILDNINLEKVVGKYEEDQIIYLIPTGEIIEIEEKKVLFENMDLLSDYFIDKTLSKEELYSLLISSNFSDIYKKAIKNVKIIEKEDFLS